MAGKVGFEPTTSRLTADGSTIELPANISKIGGLCRNRTYDQPVMSRLL